MRKRLLSFGLLCVISFLISGCSNATGYYRSGKKCFRNGEYEKAANEFSAAITENPNKANYYIDYGMTLIALGDYSEAITQFDKVYMDKEIVMVKENNKRALRGKGIAYYSLHMHEDAVEAFNMALHINELAEMDKDILYYKGNSLLAVGNYEDARDTYSLYLETYGNDYGVLCDRAYAYRKLGEYKLSLTDYDTAITLKTKCYEGYFGKYYLLKEQSDEASAREILEKASAIKPETKEDSFNLSKVYYYQGLYYMALPELSEAFVNGFTDAYFYIGEIYAKKNDYDQAISYYQKYIEESDSPVLAVYNQAASCYMKKEDYKMALEYIEKGISYKNAGVIEALKKNEIVSYENMGKFDIAFEKLKEYIEKYSDDSSAKRELEFIKSRLIDIDIYGINE